MEHAALRQVCILDAGIDHSDTGAPDPELVRVDECHLVLERILDIDAFAAALDGKLDMVCKGHDEIGVELALKLHLCKIDDIGGSQKHIVGKPGKRACHASAHIEEDTLHFVGGGDVVWHALEADALAEHDDIAAGIIDAERYVVVDLLDKAHKNTLQASTRDEDFESCHTSRK